MNPLRSQISLREDADSVLPVHVLGCLPSSGVDRGLDRIRGGLQLRTFEEFVAGPFDEWAHTGVLLPPHVETSQLVEDWEGCAYLAARFGPGAMIGNVVALVDGDCFFDHLASSDPVSARGWGTNDHDMRTVADLFVGQIESATHLVLTGRPGALESAAHHLRALNPTAERIFLEQVSDEKLRDALSRPRSLSLCDSVSPSAQVVPPWLELLRAESVVASAPGRFLYRRSRPFDPERLGDWLSSPPRGILRGKGKVWLANRLDESFGYSCAGSIHRLFPAGRWWADYGGSTWPECDEARRRLLDRWHPSFGDRRQEVALVGVGVDVAEISGTLDACLVSEEEAMDSIATLAVGAEMHSGAPSGIGFH